MALLKNPIVSKRNICGIYAEKKPESNSGLFGKAGYAYWAA
jgi:hypothetical protein